MTSTDPTRAERRCHRAGMFALGDLAGASPRELCKIENGDAKVTVVELGRFEHSLIKCEVCQYGEGEDVGTEFAGLFAVLRMNMRLHLEVVLPIEWLFSLNLCRPRKLLIM